MIAGVGVLITLYLLDANFSSKRTRILIKDWSNTGQILVKDWSKDGLGRKNLIKKDQNRI